MENNHRADETSEGGRHIIETIEKRYLFARVFVPPNRFHRIKQGLRVADFQPAVLCVRETHCVHVRGRVRLCVCACVCATVCGWPCAINDLLFRKLFSGLAHNRTQATTAMHKRYGQHLSNEALNNEGRKRETTENKHNAGTVH